jgi:hypothetical protein
MPWGSPGAVVLATDDLRSRRCGGCRIRKSMHEEVAGIFAGTAGEMNEFLDPPG